MILLSLLFLLLIYYYFYLYVWESPFCAFVHNSTLAQKWYALGSWSHQGSREDPKRKKRLHLHRSFSSFFLSLRSSLFNYHLASHRTLRIHNTSDFSRVKYPVREGPWWIPYHHAIKLSESRKEKKKSSGGYGWWASSAIRNLLPENYNDSRFFFPRFSFFSPLHISTKKLDRSASASAVVLEWCSKKFHNPTQLELG